MRKIKELEERIAGIETTIVEIKRKELCNQEVRRNRHIAVLDRLTGIEAKQKEQEEFLKNTVVPFIADALIEKLGKGMTGIADALADLFAEEPKKNPMKEPKDDKKKVGRPKQKKESK